MLAADLIFKDIIERRIADLRERPNRADDIFRGTSSSTRTAIKGYLAGDTPIDVRLGWVQAATRLPCIAIVLPSEQESQQVIGSDPGDGHDSETGMPLPSWDVIDGVYSEQATTGFSGSVDAAVYAANATEASWLAAIVKWVALTARPALEDHGMVEQRITMTDFMPASDYPQPDPAYTRVVKIAYTWYVVYTLEDDDPADAATASRHAVDMLND